MLGKQDELNFKDSRVSVRDLFLCKEIRKKKGILSTEITECLIQNDLRGKYVSFDLQKDLPFSMTNFPSLFLSIYLSIYLSPSLSLSPSLYLGISLNAWQRGQDYY